MVRHVPSWVLALLVYSLLAIGLTWPLITQWTTHLPGGFHKDGLEDAYQNVWNLWWTVEALRRPTNPLITDRFFYPEQPNLFYHTLSPANTLLAAPITAIWGPIAGFNAIALFSLIAGGMGAWALARERSASVAGALLAGIVFAWSPFHLAAIVEDGQLQIMALQWLPWYVLFLLRSAERGGWRNLGLAGLFLVLIAWTDWYYTLFMLFFTAGYAFWQFAICDWNARRTLLLRLSGIGLLAAFGSAPLILPMLIEAARYTYMNRYDPSDPVRLSADLIAYLVPARLHSWWGATPWEWGVPYSINRRFYLGGVALVLALLGMWRYREARAWGIAALAFALLSLGPTLRILGNDTGLPLPYQLLADLPIVRLTRQPDRFNVLVTLALAMMVAYGTRALLSPWQRSAPASPAAGAANPRLLRQSVAHIVCTVVLALLLLIDYLPTPIETRQPPVPPFLAQLPANDDGALIEYPFQVAVPYRDAERMLFQTIHEHPISGGYHSRLYPQPQLGLPVLRDLLAGQLESDIVIENGDWRSALRTLNYRYIIGYKQRPLGPRNLQPGAEEDAFRRLVNSGLQVAGPDYEDDWLIAYRVPDATPRPVVQIRDGWGAIEGTTPTERYRWLGTTAELGLFAPQAGMYRLSFVATPAAGPRRLAISTPNGTLEFTLAAQPRRYTLLLHLAAGRSILQLNALDPPTTGQALEGNGDQRPINIRFAQISLTQVEP